MGATTLSQGVCSCIRRSLGAVEALGVGSEDAELQRGDGKSSGSGSGSLFAVCGIAAGA